MLSSSSWVKEMQRCPNIHILALLNSILCQFKPSNPSLNQTGQYPLLYHHICIKKKERKRLSNAFFMKKDNSIRLRLLKQHKCCPSGTMLSMVTGYLWCSFLFNPDEGKLHQVHLLFYSGDVLTCWCSLPYLQKKQVVNKCQFLPEKVAFCINF